MGAESVSPRDLEVSAGAETARRRARSCAAVAFSAARLALTSALVLTPCLWRERIPAGDLGSHLYNAWLAGLVQRGQLEGLAVVPQCTNALFDGMLRLLMALGGPQVAERVAVSVCVLIFFWGAWSLVGAMARRRAWWIAPGLAVLTYGWVFHMGFFNFYLSLGLCCWALARWWKLGAKSPTAWALLAAAVLAHPLPVAWALGVGGYGIAARRMRPRTRPLLTAAALAGVAVLSWGASRFAFAEWNIRRLAAATGADQAWVFDTKYFPLAVGLMSAWGLAFLRLVALRGRLRFLLDVRTQVLLLTAAGVLILPDGLWFPQDALPFQFLSERMSLATGVLACGMLGQVRPRRWETILAVAVAAGFFMMLWKDHGRLVRVEQEVRRLVLALAPGQRVLSGLCQANSRVDGLRHVIDRACIGRCFSYGNYEPSSRQFMVRVLRPNRVVVATRQQVGEIEVGQYRVRPQDLPLYQVEWAADGGLRLRALAAGEPAGASVCRMAWQ